MVLKQMVPRNECPPGADVFYAILKCAHRSLPACALDTNW